MKLLCIGKSGQIARALHERSFVADVDCHCFGRPEIDLSRPESLHDALKKTSPDVVINAAAYTAVDAAEEDEATAFAINSDGADALARACASREIPLIHLSTDYVFDGTLKRPYRETDPTSPLSVYGASKLAGEAAVKQAGSKHIVLRTSWVYSPFGNNFVKTMLRLAKQNGSASVVDDQYGCPTSAFDIADTVLNICDQVARAPTPDKFGVFHYSGKGACSWAAMAEVIFDAYYQQTDCKIELNAISTSEYPTLAKRPANSRLDNSKIKQVFGIEPKAWEDRLVSLVNRLIEEGL